MKWRWVNEKIIMFFWRRKSKKKKSIGKQSLHSESISISAKKYVHDQKVYFREFLYEL